MPAVNPTRLSFQIAELLESLEDPIKFHKTLRDLFSLYANRTLRYGEEAGLAPSIPMYRLPDPVMRQLKSELQPVVSDNPEAALALADTLWQDATLEVRQVAVFLLGQAAVDKPEPIISRLNQWLKPDLDPVIQEMVFISGTQRLQSRFPDSWETWIEALLARKEPHWIVLGLIGLRVSLQQPSPSQKLPVIFRLISAIIRDPQTRIMNELRRLIQELAQHSPIETAYFLRQMLSLSSAQGTARLVRQTLQAFPPEIQLELKSAIKSS